MRPAADAVELEVVGIGLGPYAPLFRLLDAVGIALALGIGHGLLQRVEAHLDLRAGIGGTGPAHQRVHAAAAFRLELQDPLLSARAPRLHRRLGGLIDPCPHPALSPSSAAALTRPVRRPMVGARGFDPPPSCSQSRHSTWLSYAPSVARQAM